MKKKLIKILTTTLSLIIVLSSMIISGITAGRNLPASSLSFAIQSEDESNENQQVQTTPFLIDPTIIKTDDKNIYVFDSFDNSLKVIDKESNDFRQENTSFKTLLTVSDILLTSENILLYDKENVKIECLKKEDLSLVDVDDSVVSHFISAKYILPVEISNTDYLLVCPEKPLENNFELISFNNGDLFSVKEVKSFKISSEFSDIQNYNYIYASENNGNLFLVLINNNSVLSFTYDITSSGDITASTAITNFTKKSEIKSLSEIVLEDQTKLIAFEFEDKIELYALNISVSGVSLDYIANQDIALDEEFDLTYICSNKNTLSLLSSSLQKIQNYTYGGDLSSLNVQTSEKTNPTITDEIWTDLTSFKYYYAFKDTALYTKPYAKAELSSVPQGSFIAEIGQGKVGDNVINGYSLVLYSADDTNFYGYIKSSDIALLTESVFESDRVTVLNNTALLSFPSFVRDEKTKELAMLKTTANVTVLSSLNGYKAMGTRYILVKVHTDEGDTVGFIDLSRARAWKEKSNRVITNATVKRNNSSIFTAEDDKSDVLLTLNDGKRVKILGKRNTKTNLTHICFNDDAGNYHEGYIYTYNLETDTWSMLQIFGMGLIILNTILLVVIICIKNKVTK